MRQRYLFILSEGGGVEWDVSLSSVGIGMDAWSVIKSGPLASGFIYREGPRDGDRNTALFTRCWIMTGCAKPEAEARFAESASIAAWRRLDTPPASREGRKMRKVAVSIGQHDWIGSLAKLINLGFQPLRRLQEPALVQLTMEGMDLYVMGHTDMTNEELWKNRTCDGQTVWDLQDAKHSADSL